jgi:hypothetical protein
MRRALGTVLLAGSLVAELGAPASAAVLKTSTTKDGRIVVSISGEITDGDTDALRSAIKIANDAGKLVSSVRLNSPGGSLYEGAKLAETVRVAKIATNVGQGATCASACFLIFAAGEAKFANYTAQIGVHGASDESGAETMQSGAATVSMARIAKELGVPPEIIGRMVVTPPSDMVWLSPQELQSMGVSMVGKPAQLLAQPQTPNVQQLPPEGPKNIAPTAKASAPSWDDFVNRATALSAQQNNGTPKYFRGCQPQAGVCITGLSYRDKDNADMAIKVTKDARDVLISREVCAFNEMGDVRLCVDWDKSTSHRDMKDIKGDWYKVSDD